MTTVICDKAEKAQALLDNAEKIPSLKTIIVVDTISEGNQATAKKHNIRLLSFREVEVCSNVSATIIFRLKFKMSPLVPNLI